MPSLIPVRTLTDFSFLSTNNHSRPRPSVGGSGANSASTVVARRVASRSGRPGCRVRRCPGGCRADDCRPPTDCCRGHPGRPPPCRRRAGSRHDHRRAAASRRAPRGSCSSCALRTACGAPRAPPASCCCCRVRRHGSRRPDGRRCDRRRRAVLLRPGLQDDAVPAAPRPEPAPVGRCRCRRRRGRSLRRAPPAAPPWPPGRPP